MSYYIAIGTGFGLLAAGIATGIIWFFDLQPEKNPETLGAAGAVVVVMAIMLEWRKRLAEAEHEGARAREEPDQKDRLRRLADVSTDEIAEVCRAEAGE